MQNKLSPEQILEITSEKARRANAACFRYCLIGDSKVGKTSLIQNLNGPSWFFPTPDEYYCEPKEMFIKALDQGLVVLKDTSSHPDDLDSTLTECLRSHCILMVYDNSKKESLESLQNYWYPIIQSVYDEYGLKHPIFKVAASKTDLAPFEGPENETGMKIERWFPAIATESAAWVPEILEYDLQNLDTEEKDFLTQLFYHIDQDQDGSLNQIELSDFFEAVKAVEQADDFLDAWNEADLRGDKEACNLDEFLFILSTMKSVGSISEFRNVQMIYGIHEYATRSLLPLDQQRFEEFGVFTPLDPNARIDRIIAYCIEDVESFMSSGTLDPDLATIAANVYYISMQVETMGIQTIKPHLDLFVKAILHILELFPVSTDVELSSVMVDNVRVVATITDLFSLVNLASEYIIPLTLIEAIDTYLDRFPTINLLIPSLIGADEARDFMQQKGVANRIPKMYASFEPYDVIEATCAILTQNGVKLLPESQVPKSTPAAPAYSSVVTSPPAKQAPASQKPAPASSAMKQTTGPGRTNTPAQEEDNKQVRFTPSSFEKVPSAAASHPDRDAPAPKPALKPAMKTYNPPSSAPASTPAKPATKPAAKPAPSPSAKQSSTPSRFQSSPASTSSGSGSDKCPLCSKTVYAVEAVRTQQQTFHKGCFKCQEPGCSISLTLSNFKSWGGRIYCAKHMPSVKPTAVSVKDNFSTATAVSAPKVTKVQGVQKNSRMTFAPGRLKPGMFQ